MYSLWKRIEKPSQSWPYYLNERDECYYALEYISGRQDRVWSLVWNFKKSRKTCDENKRLVYFRNTAVNSFTNMLLGSPSVIPENANIVMAPTSKKPDHEDYTHRFEDLGIQLKQKRPDINILNLFELTENRQALHQSSSTKRTSDDIYDKLTWIGGNVTSKCIYFIDDMISSGSTFKACQKLILEKNNGTVLIGLFLAKLVCQE